MAVQSSLPKAPAERDILEMILGLFSVLVRYKWLIAAITLTAFLISILFSVITLVLPPGKSPLPNTYTAVSSILMQQEEGVSMEATLSLLGLAAPGTATTGTYDAGQLAIRVMNSREYIDTLLEDFDLYEKFGISRSRKTQARRIVLSQSSFSYEKSTRTLAIGFTSIDPVFARDMVSRMVEILDQWFLERGGTSKQRQKALLEQKLKEVSTEVTRLEDQVKKFQETYGVLRVEDLTASQSQILDNLRSQYRVKEIEIQNYMKFVKIEDPNLSMMKSQRDNLLEQIKQIEGGFTNPSGTIVPAKQDLPELARQFENLNSALRIQKNIFEALSQQHELAKLAVEGEPVFQVLEAVEVPDVKSGPRRSRICITATLLALLGSAALALAMNSLRSRLKGPGSLQQLAGRV